MNKPTRVYILLSSSTSFLIHVLFQPMSNEFPRPPFDSHDHPTPPLTIVLSLIFITFLFVGLFSIYFCRCVVESFLHSRDLRSSPSDLHPHSDSPTAPPGLDPLLINTFPTFPYSGIKEFRSEKFGLECAICLVEFDDDSFLRLLTVCCHVFHKECIDLWLESHKTCPVCRRDLDSNSPNKPPDEQQISHQESIEDAISIEIGDIDDVDADADDDDEAPGENRGKQRSETESAAAALEEESRKKFSRSHSTGHSIVKVGREGEDPDQDRYKLRLPEHVKIKLVRGHNWTRSCITFEEFLRNPGNGVGISNLSETAHQNNLYKPP